jgi:hypothetical protein
MAEIKYKPIRHNHKAFLRKAEMRSGFQDAYRALAVEYEVASKMLAAHRAHPKATSHASKESIH